jgi:hypothetical protein
MNQKILNILKVVAFTILVVDLEAQHADPLSDFTQKSYKLNHKGMVVLTTWSSVNILSGSGYFISKDPTEKYFYAMNAGWGIINLGIALPGLLAKPKVFSAKYKVLESQTKTEKIFLANAMLDIAYVTGGVLLNEMSKNQANADRKAMFKGFGQSIILQGAGLFAFDLGMIIVNNKTRKKHLNKLIENSEIAFNSNQIYYKLNF